MLIAPALSAQRSLAQAQSRSTRHGSPGYDPRQYPVDALRMRGTREVGLISAPSLGLRQTPGTTDATGTSLDMNPDRLELLDSDPTTPALEV